MKAMLKTSTVVVEEEEVDNCMEDIDRQEVVVEEVYIDTALPQDIDKGIDLQDTEASVSMLMVLLCKEDNQDNQCLHFQLLQNRIRHLHHHRHHHWYRYFVLLGLRVEMVDKVELHSFLHSYWSENLLEGICK